ncbi:hypothetical protein FN846DRAFT_391586 [Sphaerosporella brunnea]|uniref:Uncharacterized protein n=1 Tax=Sphaerosporella brunnea TaxID=1250544 RepID=A0A5J5F5B7_9PEZI|nr:hypothetical protein FN846DRAFT_391586 [Sphaerosporella brunnea]
MLARLLQTTAALLLTLTAAAQPRQAVLNSPIATCTPYRPLQNPSFEDGIGPSFPPWVVNTTSTHVRFGAITGTAHSGERSVLITTGAGRSMVALKQRVDGEERDYRFAAWIRICGECKIAWDVGGAAVVLSDEERGEWRRVEGRVSGRPIDAVRMVATCEGEAEVEIDDVLLEGLCR